MSETEQQKKNMHIVQSALDNARAGKLELAKPFFAEDVVLDVAESLPHGGVYRGWDAYVECLKKIKNIWASTELGSREFMPIGENRVMILFDLNGRFAGNGRQVKMPIVAIWEIKDGRIVHIRPYYFDTKRFVDLATM